MAGFTPWKTKRHLQYMIAVCGLLPISAGLAGVAFGPDFIADGTGLSAPLDSHFRYLSGLLVGLGLSFWFLIPTIDRQGPMLRRLVAIVLLGGLGRVFSLIEVGYPDLGMTAGLVMELVVAPSIVFCQWRLAKASATR